MAKKKEHPLTTAQNLAAFTIAALFWGVGVAMIDPRLGVGIFLCVVGALATVWLFWASIKVMPSTRPQTWPWLGLILILIEIGLPAYLVCSRTAESKETTPKPPMPLEALPPRLDLIPSQPEPHQQSVVVPAPHSSIKIGKITAKNNGGAGIKVDGNVDLNIQDADLSGNKDGGLIVDKTKK